MPGGVSIEIKVDDAAVVSAIKRAIKRGDDFRPALREVGERLTAATLHRFDTTTASDGTAWKPLAASTLAAKARTGDSSNILIRTGRMRRSIHPVVRAKEVEIGTNIKSKTGFPYPVAMQFGTSHGVPARPWLGVDSSDERRIISIFLKHL